MAWTLLWSKIVLLPLLIPEKQPYMYHKFFFHKLLSGDIKLSDQECSLDSYLSITALIMSKLNFLPITTMKHET